MLQQREYMMQQRVRDIAQRRQLTQQQREELTCCSRDEILSIMKSCVGSSTRPTPQCRPLLVVGEMKQQSTRERAYGRQHTYCSREGESYDVQESLEVRGDSIEVIPESMSLPVVSRDRSLRYMESLRLLLMCRANAASTESIHYYGESQYGEHTCQLSIY